MQHLRQRQLEAAARKAQRCHPHVSTADNRARGNEETRIFQSGEKRVELKALAANPAKAAVDGDGKRFEPKTVHWIRLYGLNPFRFDTGALVARKIGLVSEAALFRYFASLVTWGGPPLDLAGRQRAFDPSYTHGRMNTPRSVVSSFYVPHGERSFEPVSGADGREARASKRSSRLYGTYKELLQVIEELREESARWLHAGQTNAERPVSEDVDCAAKASSGERDDVQPAPVSTALAGNGTSSVSRIELSGSS